MIIRKLQNLNIGKILEEFVAATTLRDTHEEPLLLYLGLNLGMDSRFLEVLSHPVDHLRFFT